MTRILPIAALALLAACGGDGGASGGAVSRDSAGVAIVEHPADAVASAPEWKLSAQPIASIGADENDSTVDLTTSMLGTLLPDGGVVLVTAQPSEVLRFDANGNRTGMIGRPGSGPGEYRFVMQLLRLGGDTVFIFDAVSRKGMIFPGSGGGMIAALDFPVPADRPFPPLIRGRLSNGTFIHSGESIIPTPPAGASGNYRVPMPMFAYRVGAPAYDTIFTTQSNVSYASTFDLGDSTVAVSRPVAFGATTQIAVGQRDIWTSLADRYDIERRDSSGKVTAVVRMQVPPRPVTDADKERYKSELRTAYDRIKGLMPPAMLASELKKIDESVFAQNFAAISQMAVDGSDALWVTAGSPLTDSLTTWAVFDRDGRIQGRVVIPDGQLMNVAQDRLVLRREDKESGVVRFEVWGLTRN